VEFFKSSPTVSSISRESSSSDPARASDVADFEFDDIPLMDVEPLPNIRDGIFVKRLVKTLRYVTDMGRCQYVVQRPERVRRRERLNIEYVDRRASESLVLQRGDQSLLLDDRPA
jgi:hypothetical protein